MTPNIQDHAFSKLSGFQYNMDINIMRTALTLFLVVITVVVVLNILHLYAKCVLRRRARLHRTTRLVEIRFAEEPQVNSREPPKIGLDSSIIASLPTFPYKTATDRVGQTDSKECAVCLGTLENEEIVKVLPNCKHIYHEQCIDMWLDSNSTCPVCRTGAKPLESTTDDHPQVLSELNVISRGDDGVVRVALPVESANSVMTTSSEVKEEESISDQLSSLRRILSLQRSNRTNQQQHSGQSVGGEDIERQ